MPHEVVLVVVVTILLAVLYSSGGYCALAVARKRPMRPATVSLPGSLPNVKELVEGVVFRGAVLDLAVSLRADPPSDLVEFDALIEAWRSSLAGPAGPAVVVAPLCPSAVVAELDITLTVPVSCCPAAEKDGKFTLVGTITDATKEVRDLPMRLDKLRLAELQEECLVRRLPLSLPGCSRHKTRAELIASLREEAATSLPKSTRSSKSFMSSSPIKARWCQACQLCKLPVVSGDWILRTEAGWVHAGCAEKSQ